MAKITLSIYADVKEATKGVSELKTQVQMLANTLSSVKVNKDLTTQVKAMTDYYKALSGAATKAAQSEQQAAINAEKLKQEQNKTALAAQKLADAEQRAAQSAQKFEQQMAKGNTTAKQADDYANKLRKSYANLSVQLEKLAKQYPTGTFTAQAQSVKSAKDSLETYIAEYKNTDDVDLFKTRLDGLDSKYKEITADTATLKSETKQLGNTAVSTGDRIATLVTKVGKWFVATTLIYAPIKLAKKGLRELTETLKETEDAVVELQRVISENVDYSQITDDLYNIAAEYGQTIENVQDLASSFAKTGMSYEETIEAVRAGILALNVAELDSAEASEGMVAIMQQFGLDSSELVDVIDKLNITADNAAVTTSELMAALQRTGSSAKNANMSLEETISLITALSEATGASGSRLGTALNSLIQYTKKDKALAMFAGLSDNVASVVAEYKKGAASILDIWGAVSGEIQNLSTKQADLLDEYFNTTEGSELKEALGAELGDIYDSLTGVYDTANTYRKNYFIALLGNMDQVKESQATMENASGYSEEENLKYMETYTAKVNILTATWQQLAAQENGVLDLMKGIADIGADIGDIVGDMGGIGSSVAYITSTLVTLNSILRMLTGNTSKLLTSVIQSTVTNLAKMSNTLGKIGTRLSNFKNKVQEATALNGKFKGTLTAVGSSLKNIGTSLGSVTKYYNLEKAAIQAAQTATEAKTAADNIAKTAGEGSAAAVQAQTVAQEADTTAKTAATAATEALTAATATLSTVVNIAMIVISLLTIIITSSVNAAKKSKQAIEDNIKALQDQAQTATDAAEALNDQTEALFDNVQALLAYNEILSDSTKTDEEKADALSEIISLSGELYDKYGLQNDAVAELTATQDGLNDAMREYLELAKQLAAQEANNAYNTAAKALKDANTAVDQTSAKISLSGPVANERVRRGLIESGITTSESKEYGLTKGVGVYGATAMEFPATEESLATLNEWKDKIQKRVNDEKITNASRSEARAALAAVTSAIKTIEEVLEVKADAESAQTKAWSQKELLNNGTLSSLFYGAQGSDYANSESYQQLIAAINASADYTDAQKTALKNLVMQELKDYVVKYQEATDATSDTLDNLNDIEIKLEDISDEIRDNIVAALKAARDEEQQALDLAEKQLAVKEAEQALLDKSNERTVRVYNKTSGQWELQANQGEVAKAQENLQSAIDSLNDYVEKQAWDEVIAAIEAGTATTEDIVGILNTWAASTYGNDDSAPEWLTTITDILKGFNLNITVNDNTVSTTPIEDNSGGGTGGSGGTGNSPWTSYSHAEAAGFSNIAMRTEWARSSNKMGYATYQDYLNAMYRKYVGEYDDGGVLNGLGGIKATPLTESVNDPTMTAKILSPTSNSRFAEFTKNLGLMFGVAEKVGGGANGGVTTNNNGDISDNHSINYYINGLNINEETANNYSLKDIIGLFPYTKSV